MVFSTNRTESASPLTALSLRTATISKTTGSFAEELATTLKGGIAASRAASRAEGHNLASSQVSGGGASVRESTTKPTPFTPVSDRSGSGSTTSPTANSTTSPITPGATAGGPTMLGMGPAAGTAPVQVPAASQTTTATAQMTEGDAYWAAQPAAVQVLRYMPDDANKQALATKLTQQGYTIDTQIMVMGWDPQMTMAARAGYGYTWVPAWGQAPINVQPGISDPYESSNYNAASPPAGSIMVSTAFANGTIQNPLVNAGNTNT